MRWLLLPVLAVVAIAIAISTFEVMRAFVEVYEKTGRRNMLLQGLPSAIFVALAVLAAAAWGLYWVFVRL